MPTYRVIYIGLFVVHSKMALYNIALSVGPSLSSFQTQNKLIRLHIHVALNSFIGYDTGYTGCTVRYCPGHCGAGCEILPMARL